MGATEALGVDAFIFSQSDLNSFEISTGSTEVGLEGVLVLSDSSLDFSDVLVDRTKISEMLPPLAHSGI